MPIIRITRRGTIGQCSCKVGGCRKCGSACRRCKCACDGVAPLDALSRKVGKVAKKTTRKQRLQKTSSTRKRRQSTKKVVGGGIHMLNENNITNDNNDNTLTIQTDKQLDNNNVCVEVTETSTKKKSTKSDEESEEKAIRLSNRRTRHSRELRSCRIQNQNISTKKHNCQLSFTSTKENENIIVEKKSVENESNAEITGSKRLSKLKEKLNFDEFLEPCTDSSSDDSSSDEPYTDKGSEPDNKTTGTSISTTKGEGTKKRKRYLITVKQAIGTDTELQNSARQIQRNGIHTELVLNLVMQTQKVGNSVGKSKEPSVENNILVPKIPILPEFETKVDENEQNNLLVLDSNLMISTENESTCSGITDNFSKFVKSNVITTDSILDFFAQAEYMKKYMPSLKLRNTSTTLVNFDNQRFRYLYHSVKKMIYKIIETFVPGPSQHEFMDTLFTDILESKKNKQGSNNYCPNIKSKWDRLTKVICNVEKHSRINSIEKRVSRAILNKGLAESDLQHLMSVHDFKFASGRARMRARQDIAKLLDGEKLSVPTRHVKRVSDNVITKVVDFILSSNNVVPNSYGVKNIRLGSDEIITLPKLQRKNTRIKIYEDYKDNTINDEYSLSRETFYRIINKCTAHDQVSLSAIDYVTSTLVNETSEVLQNIVDKVIVPINRLQASNMIHSAKYFLKHKYSSHCVRAGDDICYHGLKYGLTKFPNDEKSSTDCSGCKFPFYVCKQLKEMCLASPAHDSLREDAVQVINDTSEKFKLYMAHVCRCTCQSQSLRNIEEGLKRDCLRNKGRNTKAIMIIDFKMKFETMSVRESSLEHYGKRGIGWHGCALIYYLYKIKTDDDNNIVYNASGCEIYEARKHIVYIDQILESSNKQDGIMVISLIEASIVAINDQLPFINEIILQSDNALSYQNPQVLFGLHLLNVKYHDQIFISQYTHSETQDGKTLLDAHFASMNRHLLSFMKMYKKNTTTKIQTPSGLAAALSFRSGIRNTMVQLVECDRNVMDDWVSTIEPTAKKARDYFSRANHIFYENTKSDTGTDFLDIIKESFSVKLQSFSGVDTKVTFKVNISETTFEPNEEARREISAFMKGDVLRPPVAEMDLSLNDGDSEMNDGHEPKDDFVFVNNHKYNTRRKRQATAINNEASSSDDNTDDEAYITDSSDESDDEQYDSDSKSYHYRRMRHYGPPKSDVYQSTNLISKIQIHQQQELGFVACLAQRKKVATAPSRNVTIKTSDRRDIVARAVRYAKLTITSSNFFISETSSDPMYELAKNYKPEGHEIFASSWARRQGHGKLYGQTYIGKYEDDIKEMFEHGEAISSNKMNASKMREQLMLKYPDRFSLPGEIEIKKTISALAQKKKVGPNKGGTRKRRQCDIPEWEKNLKELVKQRWEESPKDLFQAFKSIIGNNQSRWPSDIPTIINEDNTVSINVKKIKANISSAKQEIKKVGKRSLLS